jgi:uncharacterized protein YwgA
MSIIEEDQPDPDFDRERFQEAILHVCSLMQNVREISETKLHKILYYADREAYVAFGQPITGESYIRHKYGPYSEHLKDTLDSLDAKDDLLIREYKNEGVELSPKTQKCPQSFRRADEDRFSEKELQILTRVAREVFAQDTETVSRESHDIAWRSVEQFEEIPYDTSYLAVTEPDDSEEVHQWAKDMAEEKDL